ncbi:hypothetical protein [Teredinibacter sp. KSP-S5-2]|uniref:hypothetical protein n=1 Tax=Teredinibacter sp. KSP-S5-2 TaxID=3034506 RepID=UPI0029348057|nr:hypothetical protein [Teredinibacter sp. KSP-S5-2]WNO08946.1 hypothetical protein P5V12_18530 [Teredinibacter sp. KSP-S5-2]
MKVFVGVAIFFFSFFYSVLSWSGGEDDMCVYRPAYFNNDSSPIQIELGSERIDETMRSGIVKVLSHYGHKFEERNGKVFFGCNMYRDFEILVNYTKKATDEKWLGTHKQRRNSKEIK